MQNGNLFEAKVKRFFRFNCEISNECSQNNKIYYNPNMLIFEKVPIKKRKSKIICENKQINKRARVSIAKIVTDQRRAHIESLNLKNQKKNLKGVFYWFCFEIQRLRLMRVNQVKKRPYEEDTVTGRICV